VADGGVEVLGGDCCYPGAIGCVAVVGQAGGGVFQRSGSDVVLLLSGFILSRAERLWDGERQGLGVKNQDEGDEDEAAHGRGAKRRQPVVRRAPAPASP